MKKLLLLFTAILCSGTIWAEFYLNGYTTVCVDGIWYQLTGFVDDDLPGVIHNDIGGPEPLTATVVGYNSFFYDEEENYTDPEFEEVIVPEGLTNYKGDIVIPESIIYKGKEFTVIAIGAHAFEEYVSFPDFPFQSNSSRMKITKEDASKLTSVVIPNTVETIGASAFLGCSSLTSINIPSSVSEIKEDAFWSSGIETVYIDNLSAWCRISFANETSNPLCHAGNLYLKGEKVTDLVIPDGVTRIASCAFANFSSLTSVTIPNSVTSIESYAFINCPNMTSVSIPEGVTSIGYYTFANCSSLTSVTIPNSVTELGGYAFEDCSGLTSVTIGKSLGEIGDMAFFGCKNIKEVTVQSKRPPTITANVFPYRSSQILYVPKGSLDFYVIADYWWQFKEILEKGSPSGGLKGDMNNDGVLDITDALIIIDYVLGRDVSF